MNKELIQSLLGIDPEKAGRICDLIKGQADPDTFSSVQRWVTHCYNEPSDQEQRMEALNEVLDGYGVEPIRVEGVWDRFHGDIIATYINLGDTYKPTIVYDCEAEQFLLTSWGDFLEVWERERIGDQEPDVDWLTEHEDFAQDNDY